MNRPVPTARQLEYQDWEFGLFIHLGLYTYSHGGAETYAQLPDPAVFDPVNLDCDQWIRTAKEAGMRYAVLTCKHHDGFCLWPSAHGCYSVKSIPWREGRGDVVKEFTEACRKHRLKVGFYYSPFDASTPLYQEDAIAYDAYFMGQLGELLGNYGPIDILWFDGCHSEGHPYDWKRIMGAIREKAPEALVFNMGEPDFRWVGNEYGIADLPTWNVVDRLRFSIRRKAQWLPAECDCRMRLHSWGWNPDDEHTVKSVDELMGLYYYSVGRGCNLLLNIGPRPDGRLPEKDAVRLLEFGAEIRGRFGHPLQGLQVSGTAGLDNRWIYRSSEPLLIDHAVLRENLTRGEHVRRFEIRTHFGDPARDDTPRATLFKGENMGHKAICRFPPISVMNITVAVIEAQGRPELKSAEFHCSCPNAPQR